MGLTYPADWRFAEAGEVPAMPPEAVNALIELAIRIAGSAGADKKQEILEIFKGELAALAGKAPNWSSDYGWAVSDLGTAMHAAADNGATFLDAYWSAFTAAGKLVECPTVKALNGKLAKHGSPFELDPPKLVRRSADAVMSASVEPQEGTPSTLARYELGEKLGQGGFGTVYRATRRTSVAPFPCAVKLLDPSPFVADPEKARKRFAREAKALLSLEHRGIVQYVDAGFDDVGRAFLVMPLVNGKNLRDATEGMPGPGVCALMIEVLSAVMHAHEREVLHRDLKPTNILVRETDGQPIVVDFGSAYLFDDLWGDSLTTAAGPGSLGYIPSEVIADPKTRSPMHDVYSCGVILYELIGRRRPDPAAYEPLARINANLAAIDAVVQRAIAGQRERYRTAEDLRDSLREAAARV